MKKKPRMPKGLSVLQQTIFRKLYWDPSIIIREDELHHPMYEAVPWIELDTLEFYEGNNTEIAGRVNELSLDYTPDLNRPIESALLDGGTFEIIDGEYVVSGGRVVIGNGHHRKSLLKALGQSRVRTYLRTDLETEDDIRKWFIRLNESLAREKKSHQHLHDERSKGPGEDAIINKVLAEFGMKIGEESTPGVVVGVECVRGILRNYGEDGLRELFYLLFKTFHGNTDSLKTAVMEGFAAALKDERKNPLFDIDIYIEKVVNTRSAAEWKYVFTPDSSKKRSKKLMERLSKLAKLSPEERERRANNRKGK